MGLKKNVLIITMSLLVVAVFLSFKLQIPDLLTLFKSSDYSINNNIPMNDDTSVTAYISTTPYPTVAGFAENNPYVNCQFKYNGPTRMKQSDCSKSFECQIGNKWYIYNDLDKCKADQSIQYESAIVTCTGVTGIIYRLPPDKCNEITNLRLLVEESKITTQQAINNMKAITTNLESDLDSIVNDGAFPTVTPLPANYFGSWTPSQFTAPTGKCYATWNDYFNAHPNYAPQYIQGMGGTPPCD